MQFFNEINCRKLHGEFHVFKGIIGNSIFYCTLVSTSCLQVLIVEFGVHRVSFLPKEVWRLSTGVFLLFLVQVLSPFYKLSIYHVPY